MEVKGIDYKWSMYIPAEIKKRPTDTVKREKDLHIVKEWLVYEDGTRKPNLRLIWDFERPFWVTKEIYRTHKAKKESESRDKVTEYRVRQADLVNTAAAKIGMRGYKKGNLRDIKKSPYLYGCDLDSRLFIKELYNKRYGDRYIGDNVYVALDTEADTETGELFMLTISHPTFVKTYISDLYLKPLNLSHDEIKKKLLKMYREKVKSDVVKDIEPEYYIVENPGKVIEEGFKYLHKFKPDYVGVWNLEYDMGIIEQNCKDYGLDIAEVLRDPSVPKDYAYYKIKKDGDSKVTASGKFKPKKPHEKWTVVTSSSSFRFIDAMSTYNYVRVNTKQVPGGYGLDNIVKHEGVSEGKVVDFGDPIANKLVKKAWHDYMASKRKLEYIIYHQADTIIMLDLEDKIKDITSTITTLIGPSEMDVINSSPALLVNKFYHFQKSRDYVLATALKEHLGLKVLPTSGWTVTLNPFRLADIGLRIIKGMKSVSTRLFAHVYDADAVSSYPSNTTAANLSQETTVHELIGIDDYSLDHFRIQNINLIGNVCNTIEYANKIGRKPTLLQIYKRMKEKLDIA